MAQRRQIFTDMGITFHLNCEVGKDIPFSRLMSEYDAVLLGVGTYGMMKAGWNMKIPGVVQALPFLIASTREVMGLPVADEYPWIDVEGKKWWCSVVVIPRWTVSVLLSAVVLRVLSAPTAVTRPVCRARRKR